MSDVGERMVSAGLLDILASKEIGYRVLCSAKFLNLKGPCTKKYILWRANVYNVWLHDPSGRIDTLQSRRASKADDRQCLGC